MDRVALKDKLANEPRYDALVRQGEDAALLRALNDTDPGSSVVWQDIAVDDFLGAIAGETLTPAQEDRIRTYTQQRTHVPTSQAGIRTWVQAQGFNTATIAALRALAERRQTFAEVHGICARGERVGMGDLEDVLPTVAKSYLATYRAQALQEETARIARIRAAVVADGFDPDISVADALRDPTLVHPLLKATSSLNEDAKAGV